MPSQTVKEYYDKYESRIGYKLMLGGTRHFGYYAPGTWWPFPLSGAMRAMEERMYSMLDLPKGSRVLDAGCGVAHVAIYMADKGLRVEAIDLVDHHVEKGKTNVKAHDCQQAINVTRMSYQDLSFEDNSFDGAYTMETLSHATDFERALKELYRVLKPGGHLVLFEYEHDPLQKGTPAYNGIRRINELSSMTAFQDLLTGTIGKQLATTGFDDIVVRDYSDNVAPMLRLFFLVAIIPYLIIQLLGLESYFPNASAAVVFWRYQRHIQYLAISATKPE